MILLTGSTGIVGIRVLLDLMRRGEQVRALRRKDSDVEVVKEVFDFYESKDSQDLFDKIIWVEGDILDIPSLEEAMMGCDYVIHCAAVVSFHPKDKKDLDRVNHIGTANVVNIALEMDVKKLVHISSIAAIGREKQGATITENTEWSPSKYNSYYALSKFGAEREVWRGMEEGLDAVVLNPGIIFGAGKADKSSASLFSVVNNGLVFYTKGAGSFVDVRDVSDVAIRLLFSEVKSDRFILVSENIAMRDVLDRIAIALGKKKAKYVADRWLLSASWRVAAFKDVLFGSRSSLTRESARAANSVFNYSSEKVKKQLDFSFITSQESLEYFSEFYRQ